MLVILQCWIMTTEAINFVHWLIPSEMSNGWLVILYTVLPSVRENSTVDLCRWHSGFWGNVAPRRDYHVALTCSRQQLTGLSFHLRSKIRRVLRRLLSSSVEIPCRVGTAISTSVSFFARQDLADEKALQRWRYGRRAYTWMIKTPWAADRDGHRP